MQREIKFRGKSSHDNKWKFGWLIPRCMLEDPNYLNENWIATGNEDECDPVIAESVGQFIGLKDNKGNNIYEGDIVKGIRAMFRPLGMEDVTGYGDIMGSNNYIVYKDEYRVVDFILTEKSISFNLPSDINYAERSPQNKIIWEIVGNVIDNPELLKK